MFLPYSSSDNSELRTPKAKCFFQLFIEQVYPEQTKSWNFKIVFTRTREGCIPTEKHATAVNEEEIQLKFLVQGQVSRAKACFKMSLYSFLAAYTTKNCIKLTIT